MNAVPPPFEKIKYLLTDQGKTKFFTGFGYSLASWERLQNDILNAAQTAQSLTLRQKTIHGEEYEILGELNTPIGRTINITMAWYLDDGETEKLRFVTAYANP